mmetsp:Transcript_10237/g.33556  ORF Transcript_10237/g.33556 Transcript_10237/m.33556 type:complete len:121 (+) Transcript_10237:194-556(+)
MAKHMPAKRSLASACPTDLSSLVNATVMVDLTSDERYPNGFFPGKVKLIADEGYFALSSDDRKRVPRANYCVQFLAKYYKYKEASKGGPGKAKTGTVVAAELIPETYGTDKSWVLLTATP